MLIHHIHIHTHIHHIYTHIIYKEQLMKKDLKFYKDQGVGDMGGL